MDHGINLYFLNLILNFIDLISFCECDFVVFNLNKSLECSN
jgi:hypothetical protein